MTFLSLDETYQTCVRTYVCIQIYQYIYIYIYIYIYKYVHIFHAVYTNPKQDAGTGNEGAASGAEGGAAGGAAGGAVGCCGRFLVARNHPNVTGEIIHGNMERQAKTNSCLDARYHLVVFPMPQIHSGGGKM